MKRNLFLIAAASLAFVGCTNDEYIGVSPNGVQNGQGGAIMFSGVPGNISRANLTHDESASRLKNLFHVYGVKKLIDDEYANVFAKEALADGVTNVPYDVWYIDGSRSTSNQHDWEYVGTAGEAEGFTSIPAQDQTIKYWDYEGSSQYEFVAYSTTNGGTLSELTHEGFSFSANPDQLAGLYVADKKIHYNDESKGENAYNKTVTLTFRSAAAGVRLGIYETVPGYDVVGINFKTTADTDQNAKAVLAGKFISDANTAINLDVTYEEGVDVTVPGKSIVTPEFIDANKKTTFDFGYFAVSETAKMGETSTAPTWATEEQNSTETGAYTNVFPNITSENIADMVLWVDFTLKAKDNGEEIVIENAKAVVPAEYMTWEHNHRYTYLFKISDNTSGDTELYPIVFDAVVVDDATTELQGTTTTVTEPSITTYQDGSVVSDGIEYKGGEAIDVTVMETSTEGSSSKATLSDNNLKVYKVANTIESEDALLVNEKAALVTEGESPAALAVSVDFTNGASFTPEAGATYAIEYSYGTNQFVYKLVKVKAADQVEP